MAMAHDARRLTKRGTIKSSTPMRFIISLPSLYLLSTFSLPSLYLLSTFSLPSLYLLATVRFGQLLIEYSFCQRPSAEVPAASSARNIIRIILNTIPRPEYFRRQFARRSQFPLFKSDFHMPSTDTSSHCWPISKKPPVTMRRRPVRTCSSSRIALGTFHRQAER